MAIRVALNHRTRYQFSGDVWLSPHVVRLRPAPHCRTPVLSYSLTVAPESHFINWQQDPFSNRQARLVFPSPTRELKLEVDLVAELTVINPFDFFLEPYAENFPFAYEPELARELAPYLQALPAGPLMEQYVREARRGGKQPTINFLVALNQQLASQIKYLIRLEPGVQLPEQTLALRSGSCRDTAWTLVQVLRNLGLAARFVSGYLIQLAPDIKSIDGPSGVTHDFTDLHAWAEVYLPGAGWIGFDATSGLMAGEGHLPLACTVEPGSASAVTGYFSRDNADIAKPEAANSAAGESKDDFEFSMTVTRIHEDPRVTQPYTQTQWIEIEALGQQVDADLNRGDVRLTMGGEPTFVSIDDLDGPEWNSTALGPKKLELGDALVRRLRDRFATGGFIHHGQGKWYPGESLPRWAFALYWRKDGEPTWKDPALVASDKTPPAVNEDARHFIAHLAWRLKVDKRFVMPGYEDVWYYLWKERRLPINVDPLESNLANKEDRERLAKVFEQGLDHVVGYALPLRREHYVDGTGAWVSGSWFLRAERLYLAPGDSPMGFRLPLDSQPWSAPTDHPMTDPLDPSAPRGPLAAREAMSRQHYLVGQPEPRGPGWLIEQVLAPEDGVAIAVPDFAAGEGDDRGESSGGAGGIGYLPASVVPKLQPSKEAPSQPNWRGSSNLAPIPGAPAPWIVRTALCAEVRGGILRIFVPPQRYLEDYLELIAAIEDTARDLKMPVQVEGYPPPHDHRLNEIKVTPDPGVIEVNTHPAKSWSQLVDNITGLYEEARFCRLGAEKFMIDGRHTGTGGGNHIVIGGETPSDSPILRRPDLLRSLLGYWHNHPSLSYLFSGLFVGSTSQAPRFDEARADQVYELEIAFKEVPDHGSVPPWLVDRIFRNLLIDPTGNTHRAEFCIDKLYAPQSPTGRLGLLEMRAYEMPPHPQMSLTQQLLLRALIARFWREPYEARLVRWRTEIHDRFLLPHFVQQDFEDVIFDLNQSGFAFDSKWFSPHLEFRFPLFGVIQQKGIELELRQAIEPWNVLGEEPGGGGTVRFVDSSIEKLQVLVSGMVDPRHVIAVNGVRIPLHSTGTNGQYVAGVRYRAWHPAECLHPTIGVHSPLVFDIVDTWSHRSIGGCRYHVSHPGGRTYDHSPVNAYEAESRRAARLFKFGHTPGPMQPIEPPSSKEFPFTLDLRRT